MSAAPVSLVFVYNADSGLFNTVTDIAHKIFSPSTYSCQLCSLTHGYFTERKLWREFIESLNCDCTFLHRDEVDTTTFPPDMQFPAVLVKSDERYSICVSSQQLSQCRSIDALKQVIRESCLGSNSACKKS